MKTRAPLASLLSVLLTGVLAAGCGSDDGGGGGGSDNSFFARVDGEDFDPPPALAFGGLSNVIVETYIVSGTLNSDDGSMYREVQCQITGLTTTGTFVVGDPLESPQINCFYTRSSPVAGEEDSALAESGSMTITTFDTSNRKLEGTFDFVTQAYDDGTSSTITDGRFSVTYIDS